MHNKSAISLRYGAMKVLKQCFKILRKLCGGFVVGSHRGMPVGGISVGSLLDVKFKRRNVAVAGLCGVILHCLFNIREQSVAHYAERADYLRIGILFAYLFQKLGVCRAVFLLTILMILRVAVVVGAEIDNDNFRLSLGKIPQDI